MKILQEVTVWSGVKRQPNHVYLMSGDRVLAMSRWGVSEPEYFKSQSRIDRRGRKFVEVKENRWNFDMSIKVIGAETPAQPSGRSWTVTGSRGDSYTVSESGSGLSCTCAGFTFRGKCRHSDSIKQQQGL